MLMPLFNALTAAFLILAPLVCLGDANSEDTKASLIIAKRLGWAFVGYRSGPGRLGYYVFEVPSTRYQEVKVTEPSMMLWRIQGKGQVRVTEYGNVYFPDFETKKAEILSRENGWKMIIEEDAFGIHFKFTDITGSFIVTDRPSDVAAEISSKGKARIYGGVLRFPDYEKGLASELARRLDLSTFSYESPNSLEFTFTDFRSKNSFSTWDLRSLLNWINDQDVERVKRELLDSSRHVAAHELARVLEANVEASFDGHHLVFFFTDWKRKTSFKTEKPVEALQWTRQFEGVRITYEGDLRSLNQGSIFRQYVNCYEQMPLF